jgi:hypothetical protein
VVPSLSLWAARASADADAVLTTSVEDRSISFDRPLGEVATLENANRRRTMLAPKGRRVPTKPVKVFCLDGSFRCTFLAAQQCVRILVCACSTHIHLHPCSLFLSVALCGC